MLMFRVGFLALLRVCLLCLAGNFDDDEDHTISFPYLGL